MGQVIGRVTADLESARGPDVCHRLRVPRDWLSAGATIRFELPRNLACARCSGGGCDACGRSGAVSTRERQAPPEPIQVALPAGAAEDCITVRIPSKGGADDADPTLPRGHLLLTVLGAEAADSGVERVEAEVPSSTTATPTGWLVACAVIVVLVLLIWALRE